jgi:hypothetical protein
VFPPEVERAMAQEVVAAADAGFGINRQQFRIKANIVAQKLNIKNPFADGSAGRDWLKGFRRRNPDVSLRKPMKISTLRARGMDKTLVNAYFRALKEQIEMVGGNSKVIWNMDETGFQLEHKPTSVLARKGAKAVPGRVASNRDNITVLACGSAGGQVMPPMIIVKGKTHKSLYAYGTDQGPEGAVWTFQEKAWTEDVLGLQWFRKVFLPNCGPARPQLLILDGHRSHEVTELLQMARAEGITIMTMPPHTSHWLQPLDKGVFSSLTASYNRICSEFMSEGPQNVVSKANWPALFKRAWDQGFTASNMIAGFRVSGIWPLNMSVIPESAYAPSTVHESYLDHAPTFNADEIVPAVPAPNFNAAPAPTFNAVPAPQVPKSPQIYDVSIPEQNAGDCVVIDISNAIKVVGNTFGVKLAPGTGGRKRKVVGHRILTSEDVIKKKEEEQKLKEEKKKNAEEKKVRAVLKKKEKLEKEIAKRKSLEIELSKLNESM